MRIIYAQEEFPDTILKSIFLAGPTPRSTDFKSWRNDAIEYFRKAGYDGDLLVPEPKNGVWKNDYDGQIEWEDAALNMADCIMFWLPRNLNDMPAFTTSDEWGYWKDSGKAVFGAPENASKVGYQKYYAKKLSIPIASTLEETVSQAISAVGTGSERSAGERFIPLFIWETAPFQNWYKNQISAGNILEWAKLIFTFRSSSMSRRLKIWGVNAVLYSPKEKRRKSNELIIFRPDISAIMLYCPGVSSDPMDTQIVLIKELRVASTSEDGYVWELPGGSSIDPSKDALELALEECSEETGFIPDPSRLKFIGTRQVASTLSSYKASLFSCAISQAELEYFRSQKNIPHGLTQFNEFAFVEVLSLREIIDKSMIDWPTLGMIFSVLI